jgi:hypothetical protein
VVEKASAHAIPDEVEAAYRRGDLYEKHRQLDEPNRDTSGDCGSLMRRPTVGKFRRFPLGFFLKNRTGAMHSLVNLVAPHHMFMARREPGACGLLAPAGAIETVGVDLTTIGRGLRA